MMKTIRMLLFFIACCIILTAVSALETNREEIENKFKHARKKDAVRDAVDFLVSQGKSFEDTVTKDNQIGKSSTNYVTKEDGSLPVCKATMSSILSDGMFEYNNDVEYPRYDGDKCWARRIAHHVSPSCQEKEITEGIVPLHKFKWTLKQAAEGKCRMPSTDILQVAKSHLERQAQSPEGLRDPSKLPPEKAVFRDQPGKSLNILMMGLSFMSQPFVSTVCMNDKYINQQDSFAIGEKSALLPVGEIRRGDGHCSGYDSNKLDEWWPSTLHGNLSVPKSNFPHCSMDHGYMLFESKNAASYRVSEDAEPLGEPEDPSLPIVRICYTYTFNLQKFVKRGQALPCNWKWGDIDILLSIHDFKELNSVYMPRTGARHEELATLKVIHVQPIYNGYIEGKLAQAHNEHKLIPFDHSHVISYPKNCGPGDIHYRLPGVTDFATDIWYSLIATGMHEQPEHPVCRQKVCDGNKHFGTSRHVKFWGENPAT